MGYMAHARRAARNRFFGNRHHLLKARAERLLPALRARRQERRYGVEYLEPRLLLAGDIFLDTSPADYLAAPTLVSGTEAQLESLVGEIFGLLDEVEGALDVPNELDIALPGLLNREEPGADGDDVAAHEAVLLDGLLDLEGQLGSDPDFDSVAVGDIDLAALDLHDFDGDGLIGLTDLLRNAFDSGIKSAITDGVAWATVISGLDALSASITVDDPVFDGLRVGGGEATWQLDVDAGAVSIVQEAGSAYDLTFDLGFTLVRLDNFAFDLGRNADLLGFSYGADLEGDAGLPTVGLETFFEFSTTVQIDLTIAAVDADADTDFDDLHVTFTDDSDIGIRDTAAGAGARAEFLGLPSFDLRLGFIAVEAETAFFLEAGGSYANAGLVSLANLPAENPTTSDIDFGGDYSAVLTITADFDGAPAALATLQSTFASVDATVTFAADPFDPAFGPGGTGDPRTAPTVTFDTDFETWFQPFTRITADQLLDYFAQLRSFVLQFQNAPELFGFDLPFADGFSLLGSASQVADDVLDWASDIQNLLSGLFTSSGGVDQPTFTTIQDLADESAFTEALGTLLPDLVFVDGSPQLEFGLSFANTTNFTTDLDLAFNFGNLQDFGLAAATQMSIAGDLDLSLLFGIDLGATTEVAHRLEHDRARAPQQLHGRRHERGRSQPHQQRALQAQGQRPAGLHSHRRGQRLRGPGGARGGDPDGHR